MVILVKEEEKMTVYKGTKYPKDITIVREKTLVFTPKLLLATASEGYSPIRVYNDFSRFAVALINEAKKVVTANIAVSEIENIFQMSHSAQTVDLQAMVMSVPTVTPLASNSSEDEQAIISIANSTRIANGSLKGKTPIEVLNEDAEGGVKALVSQREWLKTNLEKYPVNQKQIDAIEAALKLFKAGKMNEVQPIQSTARGKEITLYKAEYRPLVRKAREDGKCPVYHIIIKWCIGQDYPVNVRITNYFAPVLKNAQGLYNVQASKAENRMDTEMCLTASEWNNVLREMKTAMFQFEVLHARECINDAENCEKRNRAASNSNSEYINS